MLAVAWTEKGRPVPGQCPQKETVTYGNVSTLSEAEKLRSLNT